MQHPLKAEQPSRWFLCPRPNPKARVRLFCFHHAGVGATFYLSWAAALEPAVELWSIQLPGRENRRDEIPFTRLDHLGPALSDALMPLLSVPYAFFGHSMGALVSYEVARQVRPGGHEPLIQFVSGFRAPQLPDPDPPLAGLPDAAFLQHLQRRYDGMPEALWKEPELMAYFLPVLRKDIELLESHAYRSAEPFSWPLYALGGRRDPRARLEQLEAWRRQTRGHFSVHQFPGGHFYLQQEREAVLRLVAGALAARLDGA